MRRLENRLEYASKIIANYDGEEPFSNYLKEVFKTNKQFGSKDRKFYKAACFSFFRLGKFAITLELKERIVLGLYLTNEGHRFQDFPELMVAYLGEGLDEEENVALKFEKLQEKYPDFDKQDVFPFEEVLSKEIDYEKLLLSIFEARPTWLRFHREMQEKTRAILSQHGFDVMELDGYSYLEDGKSLNQVQNLPFEIQDIGSQKILDSVQIEDNGNIWDCCAGAGGKSLQISEKYNNMKLYSSDLRLKALQNLLKRYERYNYQRPMLSVTDLTKPIQSIHFAYDNENELINHGYFDVIFIDAPCTGSGTWARTPENLSSFDTTDTYLYAEKQFEITKNALPFLKDSGKIIYVTCSIFKEENEDVVEKIKAELGLKCQQSFYIKGYEFKGDNFFVAEFMR